MAVETTLLDFVMRGPKCRRTTHNWRQKIVALMDYCAARQDGWAFGADSDLKATARSTTRRCLGDGRRRSLADAGRRRRSSANSSKDATQGRLVAHGRPHRSRRATTRSRRGAYRSAQFRRGATSSDMCRKTAYGVDAIDYVH